MKQVNFKIQNKAELHRGDAEIVENYFNGAERAETELSYFEGEVTINKIGNYEGYSIYEAYKDSGSVDYYYFATKNK